MDRTRIIICILCLWAQLSHGQINAFGKTIWEWGKSPSKGKLSGPNQFSLDLQDSRGGWTGLEAGGGPVSTGSIVPVTVNQTQAVRIERVGQTLNVSINGTLRFTSPTNFNSVVSQINGAVFCVYDGQATISEIDNFSCSGVTDDFSNANSPNWKFYYELPAVGTSTPNWGPTPVATQQLWNAGAQAIQGGITNGVMQFGSLRPGLLAGTGCFCGFH